MTKITDPRWAPEGLIICYLKQVCHPIFLQLPSSLLTVHHLSFSLTPIKMFGVYVENARRMNW